MAKKGAQVEKEAKEAAQAPEGGAPHQGTQESGEPSEARETIGARQQETVADAGNRHHTRPDDVGNAADGHAQAGTQAVSVKEAPGALATVPEVSEEIRERIEGLRVTLETFDRPKLPYIRFKDDFEIREGEKVTEFEGIIIYTKQSNVYYKNRYKPGESRQPDCFAPDGRTPVGPTPEATSCAKCPKNQFGSGVEGTGKACKNTRPVFVLMLSEDGDVSVIPKILRIPPTSLPLITRYATEVAADYGAIHSIRTKFSVFKKDQAQTHNNIAFKVSGRLDKQQKIDVQAIRNQWLPMMRDELFEDDHADDAPAAPAAPASAPATAPVDTTRF